MENIEAHIAKDKQILQDPTTSPQQRRHIEGELHELEGFHLEIGITFQNHLSKLLAVSMSKIGVYIIRRCSKLIA